MHVFPYQASFELPLTAFIVILTIKFAITSIPLCNTMEKNSLVHVKCLVWLSTILTLSIEYQQGAIKALVAVFGK